MNTYNQLLQNLLNSYITDSENPINNYNLAIYYDSINQLASAISYFLRSAERSDLSEFQYECLIRSAYAFRKQGTRNFTVKSLLLHSLSLCPERPEAYYMMSKFYEEQETDGHWNEVYMMSCLGLNMAKSYNRDIVKNIEYQGISQLIFQKAISSWYCGLCEESKKIFMSLLHDVKNISPDLVRLCLNNLAFMQTKPFINFNKHQNIKLKHFFKNSDIIDQNYSEAFQDLFVLTVLNGKPNGTYLEIGAGDPVYGNNTFLLETKFNWKGIALDIDENIVNLYNNKRQNKCLCKNALNINYENFLSGLNYPKNIDYLQIDCDPSEVSYQILLNLPLDTYKFGVITYEHDYYCDQTKSFQHTSSKYLESYGYVKVISNIAPDNHRNYEDWWIHPDLVNIEQYQALINTDESTKNAQHIFLEK
jgi:hypothetical protein